MSSILDKMNLRPQERRLVVIVAVVVFVVLNIWLVFPNFGELGRTQQRMGDTRKKIETYEREIGNEGAYKRKISDLSNAGGAVATEAQGLRLDTEITSQATISGVNVQSRSPVLRQASGGRTNAFFEEQAENIVVNTGEKELVDFLFNMGARDTLIRVKSMTLSRDITQMKLQGTLTLVKSFQKERPKSAAGSSAGKTSPAPKAPAPKAPAPPPKDVPKATKPPEPAAGANTNIMKRTAPTK